MTLLFLTLLAKSYIAPIFTAFCGIMVIYYFIEHQKIEVLHFFQFAFNWFFANLPSKAEVVYKIILFTTLIAGTIADLKA